MNYPQNNIEEAEVVPTRSNDVSNEISSNTTQPLQKFKPKYTNIQEAFVEIEDKDKGLLKLGALYLTELLNVGVGSTPKSDRQTLEFTYLVYGTSYPTYAVDSYIISDYNKKELKYMIRKLRQTLEIYNLNLSLQDLESVETIANACNCLKGTKVKIRVKNKYGYHKYEVISVEN